MVWIELDNAVNVRDLGELPTGNGTRTRPGRLVRSDNLQDLSPADVRRLVDDIGVTTVIDLRSVAEVTAEGPGPLRAVESVRHVHLSVLPESDGMTDAAADTAGDTTADTTADALAVGRERATARDPDDLIGAFYIGYLEDRPDSIVGALRAIADSPGTALVHCAAGKDRTGVVVALALTAVGVPRDVVIADYTATGERISAVLDRLRATPTYAADVDRISDHEHAPRSETMIRLLDWLDQEHGGVLGWLDTHGFGTLDLTRLRAKLVEG